jgi:hypothetical protein
MRRLGIILKGLLASCLTLPATTCWTLEANCWPLRRMSKDTYIVAKERCRSQGLKSATYAIKNNSVR